MPDEKRKENGHQVKQLVLVRSLVLIALQFGANGKAKQVVLVEAFCRVANSLAVGTLQSVVFFSYVDAIGASLRRQQLGG